MTRHRLALRRAAGTFAAAAIVTGFGLAVAPSANAAPPKSAPGLTSTASCIFPNADGSFTAMFGYRNTSSTDYTLPFSTAKTPYNAAGYGVAVPTATVISSVPTFFPANSSATSAIRIDVPAGQTAGWALGDSSTFATLDGSSRVCGATDVSVQNWQGELAFGGLLVPIAAAFLGRRRQLRRRALPKHPHAT